MLALLCAAGCSVAEPAWVAPLGQALARIDDGFEGRLGVYVKDLQSGGVASHDASRPLYLASTVKLIFLVAVYEAIEAGRLKLADELIVRREHLRDGSRLLRHTPPGGTISVDALLRLMIEESDNGASDMLIERVGIDAVNDALRRRGLVAGRITSLLDVRRGIYAQLDPRAKELSVEELHTVWAQRSFTRRARWLGKRLRGDAGAFTSGDLQRAYEAYYASGVNTAPMQTMGTLLELIARGELVSKQASHEMLERLRACETGEDRLRAGLPEDVALAHKTGTQHQRVCNVGVAFFAPERPVVIAACAERFKKRDAAERALSEVARATYEAIMRGER